MISGGTPKAARLMEAMAGAVAKSLMGWSFNDSRKSITPSYPATGKTSMVSVMMVVVPPFMA